MKGIVLAGGSGTRLHPITKSVSKQLLPVHDKPMIYYPVSVLMLAGIKDILLISTPQDIEGYRRLLGDGSQFGVKIHYEIQQRPDGLAQAFIIGEQFIGADEVCLVLGDNIFFGQSFSLTLMSAVHSAERGIASVFGYRVSDPHRFGVIEFDKNKKVISLEEKPIRPKSDYAVTGLYFYPNDVVKKATEVTPSERGELEITSINNFYLSEERLNVEVLGRGFAWLDTGTPESLMDAGHFIYTIERRQGFKVGCLEEIAYRNGWIGQEELANQSAAMSKTNYGQYLIKVLNGEL